MTDDAKAREDAFGKEWGFRSETRSYAEKVQAQHWFDAGWRAALEAAITSPAVDREALIQALIQAGADRYGVVKRESDVSWVADSLLTSGILRDVRDVQAEQRERDAQIADSIGHQENNRYSHIAWEAAQAIREARNA